MKDYLVKWQQRKTGNGPKNYTGNHPTPVLVDKLFLSHSLLLSLSEGERERATHTHTHTELNQLPLIILGIYVWLYMQPLMT